MIEAPTADRASLRSHVQMLHDLAGSSGIDGLLVLFAVGEDPETGRREGPRTRHFQIGDVAGMADAAISWESVPHLNVYAPWSIFRKDLARGSKGSEPDVEAVLALVADLDGDTGKTGQLPIPAPYTIESSPGNMQAVYPLARALAPDEAKPIAEVLTDAIGCDHGTKDLSHVWRIPGTLNWPNKRKLARGRAADPFPVRVAEAWTGELVDPADLIPPNRLDGPSQAAADTIREAAGTDPALQVEVAASGRPGAKFENDPAGIRKRGNLDGFSVPPASDLSPDDVLPAELEDLIRTGVQSGERSDQFHHVVGWLKDRGWSVVDIVDELSRHPDGIAAKYLRPRNRVAREVERCFPKLHEKPIRQMRRSDDGSIFDYYPNRIFCLGRNSASRRVIDFLPIIYPIAEGRKSAV